MTNSSVKGKVGEREWRDQLRQNGFEARRGQQYCGSTDSPDVICPALPNIHFEVKRVEKLNIMDAVSQAMQDCGNKIPVVAHRRNNSDWLVTMAADDWFNLIKETDQIVSIFCPKCKMPHYRKDGLTVKSQQRYECMTEGCGHYFIIS